MSHIFHVNGKTIDVTDRAAVQALTDDEYADLLKQALQEDPTSGDSIIGLQQEQPEPGTGFIIGAPPSEEGSDDD